MRALKTAAFLGLTLSTLSETVYGSSTSFLPAGAGTSVTAAIASGGTASSAVPSTLTTPVVLNQAPGVVGIQANGILEAPAPVAGAAPQTFTFQATPIAAPLANTNVNACAFQHHAAIPLWESEYLAMRCAKPLHPCLTLTYRYWEFLVNKKNRALFSSALAGTATSVTSLKTKLLKFVKATPMGSPALTDLETQCFADQTNFINTYCSNPLPPTNPPTMNLQPSYCRNDDVQMACNLFQGISAAPIQANIQACVATPGKPLENAAAGFLTKKRATAKSLMANFAMNTCGKMGFASDINNCAAAFSQQAQAVQ